MSILHIRIRETDNQYCITDYEILNIFRDTKEMMRWFAYDYDEHYSPMFQTRFEKLVKNQNLSGKDTMSAGYDGDNTFYLRDQFLYDNSQNRTLDIRNYESGIQHCCNISIMRTEWDQRQRRRNKKQGKKHQTYRRYYKNIAMYRNDLILTDKCICDPETQVLPPIHSTKQYDHWYKTFGKTENNWKNRKIRHQWQYHTDISYTSHHKSIEKGCGDDWIDKNIA